MGLILMPKSRTYNKEYKKNYRVPEKMILFVINRYSGN